MTPRWPLAVVVALVLVLGYFTVCNLIDRSQADRLEAMEDRLTDLELKARMLEAKANAIDLEGWYKWAARWYEAQFRPVQEWPGQTGVGGGE